MQISIWVLGTVVTLSALIILGTLRAPNAPGRTAFALSVTLALWWTGCVLYRHIFTDLASKILACELAWFGIVGAPLYWSLSFLTYARGRDCEKGRHLIIIAAISIFFGLMAITNSWHHAIYVELIDEATMTFEHGWLYQLAQLFAYSAMALACLVGITVSIRSHALHRWQLWALLASAIMPWIGNFCYTILGYTLLNDDPTPFLFAATGTFTLGAQVLGRLFILPPIGRDAIFAVLPDPAIVLDEEGRILELNPAAAALPGMPASAIGKKLDAPAELSAFLLDEAPHDGDRHEVELAGNGKTYELSCHSLAPWGRNSGRMILMRDVSMRKASEMRLAALSVDLQERLKENERLRTLLSEEAIRDHLTGLHNRRYAQEIVPPLLRGNTAGDRISLVIIDIDHFKMFNDRYGHQTGDEVLKIFARVLKDNLRDGDEVFRWGGEEFLIVMPACDAKEALARCQQWRDRVSSIALPNVTDLNMTFSAGLHVVLTADTATIDDAIRAADLALYRAKASGRDRTVLFAADDAPQSGSPLPRAAAKDVA